MADDKSFHQASVVEKQKDGILNAESTQSSGTTPPPTKQEQDVHAFRALVGITISDPKHQVGTTINDRKNPPRSIRCPAPSAISLFKDFLHPQPSQGVYGRAQKELLKQRLAYGLWSTMINALFVLQIILAATFTGLSAYGGHQTVLTILGAVNTVCAGLLALLKGQGLPNRLMKARNSFEKIVGSIEDAENLFSARAESGSSRGGNTANDDKDSPEAVAQKSKDAYDAAKQAQQDNHPDVYVSGIPNIAANDKVLADLTTSLEGVENRVAAKVNKEMGLLLGQSTDEGKPTVPDKSAKSH